ncbi:GIY-YIG nuclease family protein [Paenibacillus alba]|uniref:GIY-YIG nuclease family protein n=1 Tax=Paenibacillus alba TaxID=1197127 RepID=UPI00156690B8|nr:GIY-YIG nuclease family protein [Paenibacillus alba]NQX65742.1 GIY-YIG nuclease family protein [Paenibacillus alba]
MSIRQPSKGFFHELAQYCICKVVVSGNFCIAFHRWTHVIYSLGAFILIQKEANISMLHNEKVMRFIYVLKLDDGHYYIGQTDNLERRIANHGTSIGATWTNIYKPISMIETLSVGVCNYFEAKNMENDITLDYMRKFGWQRVRGGDFSNSDERAVYDKLLKLKKRNVISFEIEEPIYGEFENNQD